VSAGRVEPELTVAVAAPPDAVYALLADLERAPEWMGDRIASVRPEGDAFRYVTVSGLSGTWRWVERRPPSHLRWAGSRVTYGPLAAFSIGASFDIAPAPDGGSLVTGRLEMRAARGLRLVTPLLAREAQETWAAQLGRLGLV
jgi:uncharacterized protein YndB with AHSA1/START domain